MHLLVCAFAVVAVLALKYGGTIFVATHHHA